MAGRISVKRTQINKASTIITFSLAGAAFLTIFGLVASKAMLDQRSYNSKIIEEKEATVKTLEANIEAVDKLAVAYKEFISRPENLIGGVPTGTGDKDGDNAKLILDALPSKYDFPAVATSVEKILTQKNLLIKEISGTDDEINQAIQQNTEPKITEIPYSYTVTGSYDQMIDLITYLETSIRPLHVGMLTFKAGTGSVDMTYNGKTFYQTEKNFNVTKKVIHETE